MTIILALIFLTTIRIAYAQYKFQTEYKNKTNKIIHYHEKNQKILLQDRNKLLKIISELNGR